MNLNHQIKDINVITTWLLTDTDNDVVIRNCVVIRNRVVICKTYNKDKGMDLQ